MPATRHIFLTMRNRGKIIRVLATVVGIVIVTTIIVSKMVFTSDRLTALVLPKISQILNRQVSAENVELSFFPTIGIRITGLRVSNPSRGRFASPYFLDAKSVVIDAKILPLFKNRLEINNVIFYSPTIYVEQNARGVFNTDHLLSSAYYGKSGNVGGSLSSLLLSNFEVSNGNVIWYSGETATSVKLLNVDFSSRMRTVVEEDKLLVDSKLKAGKLEYWKGATDMFNGSPIEVSAKLDYDKRHDLLHIVSDKSSLFGIAFRSSVDLSFYPSTSIRVYAVNVDSTARGLYDLLPQAMKDMIKPATIRGRLAIGLNYLQHKKTSALDILFSLRSVHAAVRSGDSLSIGSLTAKYTVTNDSSDIEFSLQSAGLGENYASVGLNVVQGSIAYARAMVDINLEKLAKNLDIPKVDKLSGSVRADCDLSYDRRADIVNAKGKVWFSNAMVEIPIGIDTLYRGEFDGTVSLVNNLAIFKKLAITLGGTEMNVKGSFRDYQNVFLGLKTKSPSLRLTAVCKTFNTIGLLPHMNLNLGRQLFAWLPSANISLNLTIGRFISQTDTLSDVAGSFRLLHYFLRINHLKYASPYGNFNISGWTDYSQAAKTTFSIRTSISTSDFGRLTRRFLGKVDLSGGEASGTLALNGVMDDSGRVDLASLGGRGRISVSNVSIENYSVLDRLYTFLGAKGDDTARISSAALTIEVADGRVYFDSFAAHGSPLSFSLAGWHGFDGTLDYKLAMKIAAPVSSEVVRHLSRSYQDLNLQPDGILMLGIVAGGTTSDARFTIVSLNGSVADAGTFTSNSLLSLK